VPAMTRDERSRYIGVYRYVIMETVKHVPRGGIGIPLLTGIWPPALDGRLVSVRLVGHDDELGVLVSWRFIGASHLRGPRGYAPITAWYCGAVPVQRQDAKVVCHSSGPGRWQITMPLAGAEGGGRTGSQTVSYLPQGDTGIPGPIRTTRV